MHLKDADWNSEPMQTIYICRHVIWYYVDDDDNGDKW